MDNKFTQKLIVCGLLLTVMIISPLSAEGIKDIETPDAVAQPTMEAGPVEVELAVLKGPTGFGYVHLLGEGGDLGFGVTVNVQVLPSPTEAISRVVSGEVDMAALPATAAVILYNKGLPIRLAAVTGEGNLFFMTRDASFSFTPESLRELYRSGERISLPAPGSTPDLVTRYLLSAGGMSSEEIDEFLDFSISAPAQLAQMVIAGKVNYAVLPEPFATMVALKNKSVVRAGDLQESWKDATGMASYPMTALIVRNKLADETPRAYEWILDAVQASINSVNSDPAEASLLIEEHEILTAALAEAAIPSCALTYITAEDSEDAYRYFLETLAGLNPASIGGTVPDEAFFTGK